MKQAKNRNYSKNLRKTKKTKNTELAFVVPSRPSTTGASRMINKAKKNVFEPISKLPPKDALSSVHSMNKTFKKHLLTTVANSVVTGLIDHSIKGVMNKSSREFSFLEKEKITKEANSVEKFVTHFTTGTPSSESVKELAKLKGTTNKILFDSIKNLKSKRQNLNLSFGFNQKLFCFLGEKFYVTVNDYLKEFAMDKDFSYPLNDDQTAYGCVLKESVKLKILNSDKYLESNFKIHLIDIQDKDLDMSEIASITFSSDIKVKTNETGKVPNRYQLKDLSSKTSNSLMRKVLCLKNTRLDMSSGFVQNCSVVKTFSKRIPAGSIWEFDLDIFCGSGVRLDQVYYDSMKPRSGNTPSQYAIAIEAVGIECQGIQKYPDTNEEDKYTGTSPGWFNLEIKKSVELINGNISLNDYGGFNASKYAVRLFRKDVTDEVDFNVSVEDIQPTDNANFYIPVVTSKDEKKAGDR